MNQHYKILYLFENPELAILEIQRLDPSPDAELSAVFQWLVIDKQHSSMVKLWFRSMDSSDAIEERYFEQGYLKFSKSEATYIEKYNSSQYKLANHSNRNAPKEIDVLIRDYLKTV